jgi:AcrR family transcriptional regulator
MSDMNGSDPAGRHRRTSPRRPPRRAYRQEARARKTRANTDAIVTATIALLKRARRVSHITLEDIARESGLTVRTMLRRFRSREGAFEAAFAQMKEEFSRLRVPTPAGDVAAAVRSMLEQYEQIGEINMRALEEEHDLPLLHRMLEEARRMHRAWLTEVFAPQLARLSEPERARRMIALYAATDSYLWKLMRRDLHCSREEAEDAFRRLVEGVLS